uniref:Nuclear receptor n=1 Tax=Parastrongyloides trichosuri TaxID=131310 RepID=A0A0N4Z196_PARTI
MTSIHNSQITEYCLVCNVPTNSIHFGVNACKPCSSFFRRTATAGKIYKCRKATKNCTISKDKNRMCRYCRYEKCKEIGMALKNTSSPEDMLFYDSTNNLNQHEIKEKDNHSTQTSVIKSTFEIQNFKVIYDLNETINQIKSIFKSSIIKNNYHESLPLTTLQIVSVALTVFQKSMAFKRKEEMHQINSICMTSFFTYFNNYIINYSKFLMEIPNFQKYNFEAKMNYLRHSNGLIHSLFKMYFSLEVFGYNESCNLIICDYETYYNGDIILGADPLFPEEIGKNMNKLFEPIGRYCIKHLYEPLKHITLDKIEFSYLILQVIWTNSNIPNLPNECYLENEKMLKIINNELHNYYICHKNLDNYAYRIVEIMKLYSSLKDCEAIQESACTVGRIFNIFDCNLFDSEISKKKL